MIQWTCSDWRDILLSMEVITSQLAFKHKLFKRVNMSKDLCTSRSNYTKEWTPRAETLTITDRLNNYGIA